MLGYAVHVHENRNDLETLLAQKYCLKVAVCVQPKTAVRTSIFDVVYQNVSLSPNMDVVWTGQYALNWISHVPADGTRLENLNGNWQPCRLGESYSLHRTGDWDKVTISGPPGTNTIEVSGNNYARVHIVMGLQRSEPSGETAWFPVSIL